jgi:hypothetical protein
MAAKGAKVDDKKKIELYSPTFYAMCGIGGILSCGGTHALMTPLDLVKCNAQVNKEVFPSAFAGVRAIYSGSVSLSSLCCVCCVLLRCCRVSHDG